MTKREIASLAIKLMGVFILFKSLSYIPMSISSLLVAYEHGSMSGIGWDEVAGIIVGIVLSLIPLALSLVVIIFSDKAAAWLIKDDHPVELPGSVPREDVMLVVFTCIGLYLIVTGIPNLIASFFQFMVIRRSGGGAIYSNGLYYITRFIAPLVQIGLGTWLFAGSAGIVKLWQKIRS